MSFNYFRWPAVAFLAVTMAVGTPAPAHACFGLLDWLFHRNKEEAVPVAVGYAPCCDPCGGCDTCNTCQPQYGVPAYGVMPQPQLITPGSASYRWVTNYRTRRVPVPTTVYRPIMPFNAAGVPEAQYQGCATQSYITQRVPYQQYIPTYRPAIYGTPYVPAPTYGMPVANPGCSTCNAGGTTSYMPGAPTTSYYAPNSGYVTAPTTSYYAPPATGYTVPAATYAPAANPGCSSCNGGVQSNMPVQPMPATSYYAPNGTYPAGAYSSTVVPGSYRTYDLPAGAAPAPSYATTQPAALAPATQPLVSAPAPAADVAPALPAGPLQPLAPHTPSNLKPLGAQPPVVSGGHSGHGAPAHGATFAAPPASEPTGSPNMPRLKLIPDIEIEQPKSNDANRAPRLLNPEDHTASLPMSGRRKFESVPVAWNMPVADRAEVGVPASVATPAAAPEIDLQPAANAAPLDGSSATLQIPATFQAPASAAPVAQPKPQVIEWDSTGWRSERP